MNRFRHIANPLVVLGLISAFVYIYFVYLRGAAPLSLFAPSAKTEKEWDEVPAKDSNIVALAGPNVQEQNPMDPRIQLDRQNLVEQQNSVNQPNQLEAPQGNQNYIPQVQPNIPGGTQYLNQQAPPLNQNAPLQLIGVPDKALDEGHWIGLEVIPLTPAIAKANNIPPEVIGALVDEVTLLSAEAGLYAGDVITAINGKRINDLKSFWLATKEVAQSNRATVSVYGGGKYKNIEIYSTEALGVAQMEAAPMILATSKSPHGYYGPCDKCHAISKTPLNSNQLAKDRGDSLTKVAPNIRVGTPPPHRNRGKCIICHVILDPGGGLPGKVPDIVEGTPPPHADRGACTNCHTVLGSRSAPIAKTPPAIQWGAQSPHGNRGTCTKCHVVL